MPVEIDPVRPGLQLGGNFKMYSPARSVGVNSGFSCRTRLRKSLDKPRKGLGQVDGDTPRLPAKLTDFGRLGTHRNTRFLGRFPAAIAVLNAIITKENERWQAFPGSCITAID